MTCWHNLAAASMNFINYPKSHLMEITTSVAQLNDAVGKIKNEIGKVIVGQEQMIDL
jgi:hypothetical protein